MSRKRLYIHIGMHKTGTTALQAYLWKYRGPLLEAGICYPEVALSGPTHARLANVFKGPEFDAAMRRLMTPERWNPGESPYAVGEDETADVLYDRLREAIRTAAVPAAVVSSECFMEWIDPCRVAAQVAGWGMDVRIVVYLRRQDEWIQSVFNQLVKDRHIRYAGEFGDLPQFSMLDYRETLDRWAAAFGRENIVARIYSTDRLVGGDIVGDFMDVLGVRERRWEDGCDEEGINESLHRDIVAVLRRANALPASRGEHETILNALLPINDRLLARDGAGGRQLLGTEALGAILERCRESNAAVVADFLGGRGDGFVR